MHRVRAYVDTSVFGGTQDVEFEIPSRRFFERVDQGEFRVLLSPETLRELVKAPGPIQTVWQSLPPDSVEEVPIDSEVEALAGEYVHRGVVGPASESDALHVAAATVAGADLILSWNFRHIVNYNRIIGFNGVNVAQGYRSMTILSPLEVAYDDDR